MVSTVKILDQEKMSKAKSIMLNKQPHRKITNEIIVKTAVEFFVKHYKIHYGGN